MRNVVGMWLVFVMLSVVAASVFEYSRHEQHFDCVRECATSSRTVTECKELCE